MQHLYKQHSTEKEQDFFKEHYCYKTHTSATKSSAYPPSIYNPSIFTKILGGGWGGVGGSHNARGSSTFLIYITLPLPISSSSSSPHDTFLSSWLKSSVPWCWNTLQQKSVSRAQWVRESCEDWHCFNPFLLPRRMDRDNITHNHKILIIAQAQKIDYHRY